MKERPILMCGEMVRAVLQDLKTQTRRIVKPQPSPDFIPTIGLYRRTLVDKRTGEAFPDPVERFGASDENEDFPSPYGQPGDRLWVKETFCAPGAFGVHGRKLFAANPDDDAKRPRDELGKPHHWTPSIFMPRVASRITLEISEVRAERLHDITDAGAVAEGCEGCSGAVGSDHIGTDLTARLMGYEWSPSWAVPRYRLLWDSINGDRDGFGWDFNPWVWAISFRRLTP